MYNIIMYKYMGRETLRNLLKKVYFINYLINFLMKILFMKNSFNEKTPHSIEHNNDISNPKDTKSIYKTSLVLLILGLFFFITSILSIFSKEPINIIKNIFPIIIGIFMIYESISVFTNYKKNCV